MSEYCGNCERLATDLAAIAKAIMGAELDDKGKPWELDTLVGLAEDGRAAFDKIVGVEELERELAAEKAKNERLRAIVDRLPKTADGMRVIPGADTVWYFHHGGWQHCEIETSLPEDCQWNCVVLREQNLPPGCYSSREAAEAAKEKP